MDLYLYRLSLDVHSQIRQHLNEYAQDRPLLGETVENWLYALAGVSAFALTRLRQPTRRDLLDIDLDHLTPELMDRLVGVLDQSFKASRRNNKAGGVDRIARSPEFTNRIRQSVISQSRFHIGH
ncbi:hypothetical protein ABT144_12620 [Streptomyces sp. NPDC002039]|uniref:hypothetical protein n=1 Tax=Streptomyces sp. NPDC002039 TaxID=3154660 RepID=UPI003320F7D6